MQNLITIVHSVQEIGSFSLFQNVELGKASTDDKCHFAISWARSCQYQCVCKSVSKYSKRFTSYQHFSLFSEFEPTQILDQCQMTFDNLLGVMMNGIWQSICLDLVNSMCIQNFIKIYQKVQEMGPGSLSSEFEPRQNLDQSQMTFDNLLGYILSMSRCMQNFITVFHSVQEIGSFSLFQNVELGKASTDDKCHFAISWARSCQYQCVC